MKTTVFLLSILVLNKMLGPRLLSPWMRRSLNIMIYGRLHKRLGILRLLPAAILGSPQKK